jgi:3-oxoacyl-[acyl-carrier protein] reductase
MAEKALEGKVAIITGAGKNIGKAIALTLAADGAAVVVNGRGDRSIIEATAGEIRAAGGRAVPCLADVSQPDQVAAMVAASVREFGGVDIAIGNAGLRRQTPSWR